MRRRWVISSLGVGLGLALAFGVVGHVLPMRPVMARGPGLGRWPCDRIPHDWPRSPADVGPTAIGGTRGHRTTERSEWLLGSIVHYGAALRDHDRVAAIVVDVRACGFPLRCCRVTRCWERSASGAWAEVGAGIREAGAQLGAPATPGKLGTSIPLDWAILPTLANGAALGAVVLIAQVGWARLVRDDRVRRGLCPECGYPLGERAPRCPECGWER